MGWAEFAEAAEGTVELARETGFVPVQEAEGAGMIEGELAEAGGGTESAVNAGDARLDLVMHAGHFLVDDRALHRPGAHKTPAADGHLFDEEGFRGGGGFEFAGESFVDDDELGAVLDVETRELGGDVGVGKAVPPGWDRALGRGRLLLPVVAAFA